jgi:hypothetical protein
MKNKNPSAAWSCARSSRRRGAPPSPASLVGRPHLSSAARTAPRPSPAPLLDRPHRRAGGPLGPLSLLILSGLLGSGAVGGARGAFRVPGDLFLNEPNALPGNERQDLVGFLGSRSSFASLCVPIDVLALRWVWLMHQLLLWSAELFQIFVVVGFSAN